MNHLAENNQRKQKVIDLLRETADYYKKCTDDDSKANTFSKLADATEKGKFAITVVGEFSAGKSTFLNALMLDRYLPSFTKETTATVNYLRSVKESPTGKPMLRINYRDGQQKTDDDVSLNTIQKYVVSTKEYNVAQNISSVDIYLDSPFLNDGVTLVDSPGLNGLKEGHEGITIQQVQESHAVIYMFSSRQPGSKSDFKFLDSLLKSCNTVFFVLNQIDCIKKSEGETVESVIDKLKENFQKELPKAPIPEIWPIAAYPALVARCDKPMDHNGKEQHTATEKAKYLADSRIEQFEVRMMRFLTQGEKNRKALAEPLDKIEKELEARAQNLENEIILLSQDTKPEKITKQIEAIEAELHAINDKITMGKKLLKAKISTLLRNAENAIRSDTKDIRDKYIAKIGTADEFDDLVRDTNRYMHHIDDEYQVVYENTVQRINNDFLQLVLEEYGEYIDKIEQHLNENSQPGAALSLPRLSIDLSQYKTDVNIDEFIERKKQIKEELRAIENKSDSIQEQIIRIEAQQKAYERLKDEKKELQEDRNRRLASLGSRPEAITRTETEYVKKWKWFLIFPSRTVVPETHTYIDRTDQEYYDKRKKEIEESFDAELDEINKQLKDCPPDTETQRYLLEKQERKRIEREAELKEIAVEQTRKIEKEREKNMKWAKADLEDAIDEFDTKGRDEIIRQLHELESAMTNSAEFIIRTTLEDTLEQKQRERALLKSNLESEASQREQLIKEKQQQKDDAMQIIKRTEALLSEIKSVKTDKIETE